MAEDGVGHFFPQRNPPFHPPPPGGLHRGASVASANHPIWGSPMDTAHGHRPPFGNGLVSSPGMGRWGGRHQPSHLVPGAAVVDGGSLRALDNFGGYHAFPPLPNHKAAADYSSSPSHNGFHPFHPTYGSAPQHHGAMNTTHFGQASWQQHMYQPSQAPLHSHHSQSAQSQPLDHVDQRDTAAISREESEDGSDPDMFEAEDELGLSTVHSNLHQQLKQVAELPAPLHEAPTNDDQGPR
jgi:hypothetical protein